MVDLTIIEPAEAEKTGLLIDTYLDASEALTTALLDFVRGGG